MNQEHTIQPGGAVWRRLWWWGRVVVTLSLGAYLVWRMRGELATLRLHLVSPFSLALSVGGVALAILLSVGQWQILIPLSGHVPFRHLLTHYLWGSFWNNFLPSGLGGDVVRALALRSSSGRTDTAISSVFMARLISLWSVVLMGGGAVLLYAGAVGWRTLLPFLLLAGGALVATAGGTILLLYGPRLTRLPLLPGWLERGYASLRTYRDRPLVLLGALGGASVVQLCAVAINAGMAQALGLDIQPWQLFLSIPLISLVTLIPISLGGLGVREGAYVLFLGLLGTAAPDAILLSLAVFVLLNLMTAVGGGSCILLSLLSSIHSRDRSIAPKDSDL